MSSLLAARKSNAEIARYDASVYNAVQGSDNWVAWFNHPGPNIIGAINTAYTVGAIVSGFFFAGPLADRFGRRVGMGTGASLVIIATFLQTFSPQGNMGCFIGGRVLIGIGQGLALSKFNLIVLERFVDLRQRPDRSTLASWPLSTFVERSCRFGRCFILSDLLLHTVSRSAPFVGPELDSKPAMACRDQLCVQQPCRPTWRMGLENGRHIPASHAHPDRHPSHLHSRNAAVLG